MSYLPPCRQTFSGNFATVAPAANADLEWVVQPGTVNDDLLDLTVPALPTARQDGFYAITGWVYIEHTATLPTAGMLRLSVDIDYAGEDASQISTVGMDQLTAFGECYIPFSVTYFCPAGAQIRAGIYNDMNQDVQALFKAWVVRLPV